MALLTEYSIELDGRTRRRRRSEIVGKPTAQLLEAGERDGHDLPLAHA